MNSCFITLSHGIIITKQTLAQCIHAPFQNFHMQYVSYSSYEVGLLSLIGCGFEFGVNRFEKEYLRKCAF